MVAFPFQSGVHGLAGGCSSGHQQMPLPLAPTPLAGHRFGGVFASCSLAEHPVSAWPLEAVGVFGWLSSETELGLQFAAKLGASVVRECDSPCPESHATRGSLLHS